MERRSPRSAFVVGLASLRAPQWVHFCGLPLAGIGASELRDPGEWPRALLACLVAAGCLAFAYGVNAVAERESDRRADKNPLVGHPSAAPAARLAAIGAGLFAFVLAAALGTWAALACGLSLVCGAAYSVGPRGKRVPVLGLGLNTGIFVPLTALLLRSDAIPPTWGYEISVFAVLLIQNQLIHELADIDEDRAAGAMTTGRLLGEGWAIRLGLGLSFVILVLAVLLGHPMQVGIRLVLTGLVAVAAAVCVVDARRSAAQARRHHRAIAFAGGALLWLLGRWPS